MILCFCRAVEGVSDKAVKIHIQKNPQLLGQDWAAVSKDITGQEMVCGKCETEGNKCLGLIAAATDIKTPELV